VKSPIELAARLAKQWQVADNREARLLHTDVWPLTLPIGKPTSAQLIQQTEFVRTHLRLCGECTRRRSGLLLRETP
jgi:hypothetical protein